MLTVNLTLPLALTLKLTVHERSAQMADDTNRSIVPKIYIVKTIFFWVNFVLCFSTLLTNCYYCTFVTCYWQVSLCLQCSDTVRWALGRASSLYKIWVIGCWLGYLSGVRCKWFAHDPADATATPSSAASVNPERFCLSRASLPRLSLKKVVNRV